MQEAKKQLELLQINYLRSCYPGFPKGKTVPGESPDFIVRSKHGKRIGIELVRLCPDLPFGQLSEKQIQQELIHEAWELFERSSDLKLFVKVCFADNKTIGEERVLSVSAILANRIRSVVNNKNQRSFFFHLLTENELPVGIEQLLVVHHPELTEPIWEEANNLGISENIITDLKRVIARKEEKLLLYRKKQLDAYWLVVLTDRLRNIKNSNVNNRILSESFPSSFNQILLFDLVKGKVLELV